jgi:hypothetical protein
MRLRGRDALGFLAERIVVAAVQALGGGQRLQRPASTTAVVRTGMVAAATSM